ncbi:hypothetical protein AB0Y16_00995 [Escherichia coli]|uniref:hypothetical protein n=1 Tax=Escherichia TaxID=561 RepID=UPI0002CB6205|nr:MULTISPECIES: hypothetical protein [Escherichia]EFO1268293.1 hypothetical protein [Escherichia albertii]EFH6879869.1 hypothetical protein [Escherichia coli]EFK9170081.1 hypothetical protein [Escherichia coli]EFN4378946.1 hypothetical protein [Escherichia coli]EIG0795993.1 hypothetical protein [Escherichia coli]
MFRSSDLCSVFKMTALPVIFFVNISACSATYPERTASNMDSQNSESHVIEPKSGNIFNADICIGKNSDLKLCNSYERKFTPHLLYDKPDNYVLNGYYPSTSSGNLYNIVRVPESGPEWYSIAISIIALIASVGVPLWQHYKGRNEAINEGYWLREVILPKINGLAFEVTEDFKDAMGLPPDEFISLLDSQLFSKLGELRDSLYLFKGFSKLEKDIESLDGICDLFEQKVSDNIDSSIDTRVSDVSIFHASLIRELMKMHRKIG